MATAKKVQSKPGATQEPAIFNVDGGAEKIMAAAAKRLAP